MRKYLYFLKFTLLILVVFALFSFANDRNEQRRIAPLVIDFQGESNPFISEKTVNKLLKQNDDSLTNVGKETLALGEAELRLDSNAMVLESEVYRTVSGALKALIRQRTPIGRVQAKIPFYLDALGETMPLSANCTARVPLVYNVGPKEGAAVFPLLELIDGDPFLKEHIVNVTKRKENYYQLGMRLYGINVVWGGIEKSLLKVKNFKAFYKKAMKDKALATYHSIDFRYDNQVVCKRKVSKRS